MVLSSAPSAPSAPDPRDGHKPPNLHANPYYYWFSLRLCVSAVSLSLLPVVLPAQDAKDIVQRAIQVNDRNEEIARNYTYLERQDVRMLDGSGRVKDRRIETWDITMLEGSPYRRLVARNDQPLPPDQQRKEEEKLRRSNEERAKETEEQRQQRIADANKRRDERRREPLKELLEGFDLRLAGEAAVDGHDAWIVDATPRPGFKGATAVSRAIFPKVHGRFWIEKAGYHPVRVEIDTLDTISLGLFLVRLSKGSWVVIELTEVNNEVWLPKRVTLTADARVLLVKGMRVDMQIDFSAYKKFQADSRILSTGEIK
jgi:hypothetical protein